MVVKIVTKTKPDMKTGVSQYWGRLRQALTQFGVAVEWVTLDDWQGGRASGNPATDLLVMDNQDAGLVPNDYGVIAVQHGCAMENGLRNIDNKQGRGLLALGSRQFTAGMRSKTFWVGCSDWAARHCRKHMGVLADRIIFPPVDTDRFFPGIRQRRRDAKVPVILHDCRDINKGNALINAMASALSGAFEVRRLNCAPDEVPEAMRDADIWLCLSASEGGPMVIQEALATDMVVVGPNVGVLWPYCCGTRLGHHDAVASLHAGMVAWLNREIGAVVFDWRYRALPSVVAEFVVGAWRNQKELRGREYARRWYSHETFARKWLETLWLAAERFGLPLGSTAPPATAPPQATAGTGRAGTGRARA